MSDMACFGCGTDTPDILEAFEQDGPCPRCGLPAEATRGIEATYEALRDLSVIKARLERGVSAFRNLAKFSANRGECRS